MAFVAVAFTACRGEDTAQRVGPDAALADTLGRLISAAYDFERPGVAERMIGLYPDTGKVVSATGGQITTSPDSLRRDIAVFWQNVGHNMRSARWQWNALHVERLGADAAILTGTWSIPHIAPDDRPHTIRGAWTAAFRRVDGQWKIVHEHLSGS